MIIRAALTADILRDLLRYDPQTGEFWRLRTAGRWKKGESAGSADESTGYVRIRVGGILYHAHRLAWLWMTGEWPPEDIDHENGNGLDNRWANLRAATTSQNLHNARMKSNNRSGITGVHWSSGKKRWVAEIWVQNCKIGLGIHKDIEAAAAAYRAAKLRYAGEFARLQ